MKSLLLSLVFSILVLVSPASVLAAPYGEGTYGGDAYNGSDQPVSPTPGPTPSPSEIPTPAPGKKTGKKPSTQSPSVPGCAAQTPASVPDLFQIDAQAESVTLYFSPVMSNRDRYYVSYSTGEHAEEHGYEFRSDATGVIAVDIHELRSHTIYFFKVRAGNGCQPGDWSNILSITTGQRFPSYRWSSLPRIISTAGTGTSAVDSAALQQTEIDTPPPPDKPQGPIDEEEATAPTPLPREDQPPAQPTEEAQKVELPASSEAPPSPSFLDRVVGFFKRMFGR